MNIVCKDISGKEIIVQKENLKFRPTVYGIVRKEDEILLVNIRTTGKRYLPGGGIEIGENTTEALSREFKEETGIDIEVGNLLGNENS